MKFKKSDILAAFVIGEASALLLIYLSNVLGLPEVVNRYLIYLPFILPLLSIGGVIFVYFLRKRWLSMYQMGKNFLVGILNTLIDLSLLNTLMMVTGISSGWMYTVFKAVSFSSATVNSYFWNKLWAFEHEGKVEKKEFGTFYTVALGGLTIHVIVSSIVVNLIGPQFGASDQIWGTVGGMAAAVAGLLWNFMGYKLIVFKK